MNGKDTPIEKFLTKDDLLILIKKFEHDFEFFLVSLQEYVPKFIFLLKQQIEVILDAISQIGFFSGELFLELLPFVSHTFKDIFDKKPIYSRW